MASDSSPQNQKVLYANVVSFILSDLNKILAIMDLENEKSDKEEINTNDSNNNEKTQEITISIPYFTVKEYEESQIEKFDEIIDVRTPLEFEEDRIPGAVNLPVLSNEERVTVGTL